MHPSNRRAAFSRAYALPLAAAALLCSCSNDNAMTPVDINPQSITVANHPPTGSVAFSPTNPVEGQDVTITVTGHDVDGGTLTYGLDQNGDSIIDVTNGTGVFHHTFNDNGTYHLNARVTDPQNAFVSLPFTVTVTNVAPVIDGLTPSGNGPDSVSFSASWHDANPVGDGPYHVSFDWGDHTTTDSVTASNATALSLRHLYSKTGTFKVKMILTDKDAGADTASAIAVVSTDAAPVVNVHGPYTTVEGGTVVFDATGSGDPFGETTKYLWDFGDGTTSSKPAASHHYAARGNYTVTLTVKDPSGQTASATTTVAVSNTAPSAIMKSPSTIPEGSSATIVLSKGTDPNPADKIALQYAFDCGAGTYTTFSSDTTYTCPIEPDNTSRTLTAEVTDGVDTTEYSRPLTVTNVKPTIDLHGTSPGDTIAISTGHPVGWTFVVTDPGIDDAAAPFHVTITWGDGATSDATLTLPSGEIPTESVGPHTYTKIGTHTVKLKVTDKDGGSTTVTKTVVVTAVP